MNPAELAKANAEHSHQRALFAWAVMAEHHGFDAAWDDRCYGKDGQTIAQGYASSVPELHWLHAIPNGGLREKRTAAMLKAEGVKRGIPDAMLPLPVWATVQQQRDLQIPASCIIYCGLYIEMKRPKSEQQGRAGTTSNEQDEAIAYLRRNSYAVTVCFTWDQAAREIQSYIEACRKGLTRSN